MKYTDEADKLSHARELFEEAIDHTVDAHAEAHRANRFFHNTENEGQWEEGDLAYLRDEGRPALTFNVIAPKVNTFLGMYADAQRAPVVVGTSAKDNLLGEAVDIAKSEMLENADFEELTSRVLKTGTVCGECDMHIEVEESPDGPDWVQVNLYRVMPFEVHWDIGSIEPDRKDARYVFWDRWLSRAEFRSTYPEHADRWHEYTRTGAYSEAFDGDNPNGWSEPNTDSRYDSLDYQSDKWNRYYYDRQKRKIRVIRYEYLTFKTITYLTDLRTGEKMEIPESARERAEQAIAFGHPYELTEVEEERVDVCEFVGATILAEYDEAGPFDGFSIVPYCFAIDEETGTAYGFVRNLFDPQMELNKSKSLEIEYLAQSTAPGVTAEEDAILDETQFSDELRRAGGIALVKKNALVENRVQERTPTPPSAAVMNRGASAVELTNEISGIPSSSMLSPAEQGQAGMTVAIRYHKSRQSVNDPFANFEHFTKTVVKKLTQVVTRAMPDDQLLDILSSDGTYMVQGGMLVELMEHPEQPGQMVPKEQADMRDIRSMKWKLDMEYTSENSTLRMLEMDLLMQLANTGVPVDPEVLVERASNSRSVRERLKSHVEKVMKAKAEGDQAQMIALENQTKQFGMIEGAKVQETQRHNMAEEEFDRMKLMAESMLKRMDIWEKADEAEKDRLLNMAIQAQRVNAANTGAPING